MYFKLKLPDKTHIEFHGMSVRQYEALQKFQKIINCGSIGHVAMGKILKNIGK